MFRRRVVPALLVAALLVWALPAASAQAATTVKSKPGNDTLAAAQPVSPTYQARDIVGTLTKGHPSAFFAFALSVGEDLHLESRTKVPSKQFSELLLYHNGGFLVAIANGNGSNGSDSVIDYTIPPGGNGTWTAEVTGSPSHPKQQFFPYDLRVTPVSFTTSVKGHHSAKDVPGFYAMAANVGDDLHLAVSAQKPAKQFPELLLYDNGGFLVAFANGNGSNGSDSVIDYTIPSGAGGTWTAEVVGSESLPDQKHNVFPYVLTIQGDTGAGPVIPK
jgi:hypothetical protein